MLAQYVVYILDMTSDQSLYLITGRLNARARFQVMADATIPMSLNLDTISSSQRVNRESLRSVRI